MALPKLQPQSQEPGVPEIEERAPEDAEKDTEAQSEKAGYSIAGQPLTTFHAFGNLPPELRIKIWRLTFLPRVVELHPTWLNHATAVQNDGRQHQQQWQSGCNNPAALSVCSEAREIALKHFRIAYPLFSIASQRESNPGTESVPYAMFNEQVGLRRRLLYISPEYDTVALLGQNTDFSKLSDLLDSFRDSDRKGRGLSILALSAGGQGNDEPITTEYTTTVLRNLNQFILFSNGELPPPSQWSARGAGMDEQSLGCFRKMGNKCELVPCTSSNAWYVYKQWMRGKGRQFWDSQRRILDVGKNRIRIQDLEFSTGWC